MNKIFDINCFWNILLLAGVVLVILSALQGDVTVAAGRNLAKGRIAKSRQKALMLIGAVLILISVAMVALTNWGGLVSPAPATRTSAQPSDLIPQVHLVPAPTGLALMTLIAASDSDDPQPIATLTALNKRATAIPSPFDNQVAIYVEDIHLFGSPRVVVYPVTIPPGVNRLDYNKLKAQLQSKGVKPLFDGKVSNGKTIEFTHAGKSYKAKVELKWYLKGQDLAVFTIYPK